MTKEPYAWHKCWTPKSLNEAIYPDVARIPEADKALFLAANVEFYREHVTRDSDHLEIGGSIGSQILHELVDPDSPVKSEDNILIAVIGQSGCGKTHLVRWVNSHLDPEDPRFCTVYVPKELNSLKGILSNLLNALPKSPQVQDVQDALEQTIGTTKPELLVARLLFNIAEQLDELPYLPGDTSTWSKADLELRKSLIGPVIDGERSGLGELFRTKSYIRKFKGEGGAGTRIIDSLLTVRQGGDEPSPQFSENDLPAKPNDHLGSLGTAQLQQVLKKGTERRDVSIRLINEALGKAILNTIGLNQRGANQILEMFNEARRMLKDEGKELLLIFEDLAQLGTFDGELFEQFQNKGENHARIRAVFAITDGKYSEVPEGIKTRISYVYRMEKFDIYSPASEDLTALLTSRYLNAARVGRKRILDAYDKASADERLDGSWIPNQCENYDGKGEPCPHKTDCWEGFGETGGVGLFPYNRVALRKSLAKRQTDGELPTPRTIVRRVVTRVLNEAYEELKSKNLPSEEFVKNQFVHYGMMSPLEIVSDINANEEVLGRVKRVREIWADEGIEHSVVRNWFGLPEPEGERQTGSIENDIQSGGTHSELGQIVAPPTSVTGYEDGKHQAIINWHSDPEKMLGETLIKDLRDQLHADVLLKARLSDLMVQVDKNVARDFVSEEFNIHSFRFKEEGVGPFTKGDYGQSPGSRLRFPLAHDGSAPVDNRYQILSGALWLREHGHWDAASSDRKFNLQPETLYKIRETYEEFVSTCASVVRERITAKIEDIGHPVLSHLRLRVLALLAIGELSSNSPPEEILRKALTNVLSTSEGSNDAWSQVSHWALKVLSHPESIEDLTLGFATVRRDKNPYAVDALSLIEVCDPKLLLSWHSGELDASTSADIEYALNGLGEKLLDAISNDSKHVSEVFTAGLKRISNFIPSGVLADLAEGDRQSYEEFLHGADGAVRIASNSDVFSGDFAKVTKSIEFLQQQIQPRVLRMWAKFIVDESEDFTIEELVRLAMAGGDVGKVSHELKELAECLQATSYQVKNLLSAQGGGSEDQKAKDKAMKALSTLSNLINLQ